MRKPETRKQKAGGEVRSQEPEVRIEAAHSAVRRILISVCCLLASAFCLLTPAFAGTHVTATYGLPANPNVMATVNGTAEYGLVFVQRNETVTWNSIEYGKTTVEGYLNASGQLNDGAGNLYLDLVPDSDASPTGSYYVATVNIQGQVHSEIWIVPDQTTVDASLVRQTQTPQGGTNALFYQTVENAGAALAQRQALNFAGTGVSCADDAGLARTDCTITAGSGGGSGTVTNFSAGGLAPLFGASVANATTTPALSFSLSNAAAESWFGDAGGATGAPSYNTTPIPQSLIPPLNYQAPISSYSAPANEFLTGFTAPNTFTSAQPAFSNLSGTLADAQLPSDAAKFTGAITTSDCAKWSSSGVLADAGAACGSGGGMVYPGAGVANSTGSAWGTSYTVGTASGDLATLTTGGVWPNALIPAPTASTLGGIESLAATTHEWIDTISTAGVPSETQPAFTDISGTLADAQLPSDAAKFTGAITTSDCAKWSSSGVLADAGAACGGGSGTVTSVGLALPSFFSVSGSPVATNGTLTGAYATGLTANENQVLNVSATGAAEISALTTAMLPTGIPNANLANSSVTVDGQTCTLGSSCTTEIADTTASTGTTAISANTCTSQTAVTMTGLTTSMTLEFTPTSDTSTVAGWGDPTAGLLYIVDHPTANTVNWSVCNGTSSSITPGASVTWNISAR